MNADGVDDGCEGLRRVGFCEVGGYGGMGFVVDDLVEYVRDGGGVLEGKGSDLCQWNRIEGVRRYRKVTLIAKEKRS